MTHLQRWAIKQSAATLSGCAGLKCKVLHALLIGGILKVIYASCHCRKQEERWIKHHSSHICAADGVVSSSNKSSQLWVVSPWTEINVAISQSSPFVFAQQHIAVYPLSAAYIYIYTPYERFSFPNFTAGISSDLGNVLAKKQLRPVRIRVCFQMQKYFYNYAAKHILRSIKNKCVHYFSIILKSHLCPIKYWSVSQSNKVWTD